jgi:hypothetical protein
VRKAELAIAISIAVHAALIAWVSRERDKPEDVPVVATPAKAGAREPTPIAVVLLDGDSVVVRAAATTRASQPASNTTSRSSTSSPTGGQRLSVHGSRGSEQGSTTQTGAGTGTGGMMSMRGAGEGNGSRRPRYIGVSGRLMDNYHAPVDELPPPPSGELKPKGHGTYESDHPTFTARVARDGTVKLEDKPDVDVHWNWRRPLEIVGKLAIDDAIMRRKGIDPYASEKLKWLDKTRDERFAIGKQYRKDQLAKSAELMRDNLARLWERERDATARKQLVFALWDECAETGDAELVDGGKQARAYLIGFVRSHLPAGGATAYTAAELAALNKRKRSSATFAPYP